MKNAFSLLVTFSILALSTSVMAQEGTPKAQGAAPAPKPQQDKESKPSKAPEQKPAPSPAKPAAKKESSSAPSVVQRDTAGPVIQVDPKDLAAARSFQCPPAQLLQTNKDVRKSLWKFGWENYKHKKYVTAFVVFRCMQSRVPYYWQVHLAMAHVLEALGQYPEAVEYYKAGVEMTDLPPNAKIILGAKQKIKELSLKKPRPLPAKVDAILHVKEGSLATKEERIRYQEEKLQEEKAQALAKAKSEAERKAIEERYRQMELHLMEMKRKVAEERAAVEKARQAAEKARLAAEKARLEAERAKKEAEALKRQAEEIRERSLSITAYRYKEVPTTMRKTGGWFIRLSILGLFISSVPTLYAYYLWQTSSVSKESKNELQSSDRLALLWWDKRDEWQDYEKWLKVGEIGYAISAGALLTGTVLYFVGGTKKVKISYHTDVKQASSTPVLMPLAMPGGGGVAITVPW